MKIGLAVARALIGGLMIGHGTQKLFGWFGGHGPEGTGRFFEAVGVGPGRRNAIAAGAAEAGGGALLALGLFTPAAAAAVTATMGTAIASVHAERGPWVTEGGWEYNAVLIGAAFAIVDDGPGPLSLDALRGRERWGTGWALAQLAAGAAGTALVMAQGKRHAGAAQQSQGVPSGAEPGTSAPESGASGAEGVPSGQPQDPNTMPSAN